MNNKMRKVGIEIGILMSVTLSFFLSLTCLLSSYFQSSRPFVMGDFIRSFILNFIVSTVVSVSITLVVPMGKLNMTLDKSLGFKPGSIGARLVETLVSDLIYTPIVAVIMITLNYIMATSHGAQIPFAPMLAKGLMLGFLVGFVLIFIFQPIYMKIVFKKHGVQKME